MDTFRITADLRDAVLTRMRSLAERRYGSDSQDSLTLIVTDALWWKIQRWDREGQTISDWLWLKVAWYSPIPLLKRIAWGKLIEPYFDTEGGGQ